MGVPFPTRVRRREVRRARLARREPPRAWGSSIPETPRLRREPRPGRGARPGWEPQPGRGVPQEEAPQPQEEAPQPRGRAARREGARQPAGAARAAARAARQPGAAARRHGLERPGQHRVVLLLECLDSGVDGRELIVEIAGTDNEAAMRTRRSRWTSRRGPLLLPGFGGDARRRGHERRARGKRSRHG